MMNTVAGKNIEDLTSKELEAIAQEAGREAVKNAKKTRGSYHGTARRAIGLGLPRWTN